MDEEHTDDAADADTSGARALAHRLGMAGWAAFFIWIGIALWLSERVSMGVALLGVGIIMLAGQVARKWFRLKLEWVWLVVGLLLVLSGGSELINWQPQLAPIVLILGGVALFVLAIKGKRRPKE